MFQYVVLHVGVGGNPRNTTDLQHPYIRILNRAVELTKWFATVLFRPQSVILHVELRVVVLLFILYLAVKSMHIKTNRNYINHW